MYQGKNPTALQSQNLITEALLALMEEEPFQKDRHYGGKSGQEPGHNECVYKILPSRYPKIIYKASRTSMFFTHSPKISRHKKFTILPRVSS